MEEDKLLEAGRLEAAEEEGRLEEAEEAGSHIGHLPTEKKSTLCKVVHCI